MPLGTIDRTPPPFFRQGPSAFTKLALFSALAVFLMAADSRWRVTQPLRAALATGLLPVQGALQVPVDLLNNGLSYLQGVKAAQAAGFGTIVSARSGETEDVTIVHLAVGWNIGRRRERSVLAPSWSGGQLLPLDSAKGFGNAAPRPPRRTKRLRNDASSNCRTDSCQMRLSTVPREDSPDKYAEKETGRILVPPSGLARS